MPKRKRPTALSEAQLEIMTILWRAGGGTVADVLEQLQERRKVSRNTVQTMLSRLDQRGCVTHRDEAGAFFYTPAITRDEVQQQVLRRVVDTVFDGSAAGIVMALFHDRSLTKDEAARIRRMIKEAEERR
jgi:predicted transcriptional regulator